MVSEKEKNFLRLLRTGEDSDTTLLMLLSTDLRHFIFVIEVLPRKVSDLEVCWPKVERLQNLKVLSLIRFMRKAEVKGVGSVA